MKQSERMDEMNFTGDLKGNTVRRILSLTLTQKPLLIGFILCISLTALLDATSTYLTKFMLDLGILAGNRDELIRYTLYLVGLFVVNSGLFFGFIYCAGRLGEQMQFDLRERLFNHLQDLSFSFFNKTSSGWLLSRITSDTRRIAELCSWMFLDAIWGIFNIGFSLIFMSFISPKLALLMLFIIPLLAIVAVKFKTRIIKEFRKVRSINSRITSAYSENINGVKIVKALTREEINSQEFEGLTTEMYHSSYRAAWLSGLFLPMVQLITSLALVVILVYGGREISLDRMTVGGLRAFIGFVVFMIWPVQNLARVFSEMQQAIVSAERVFYLLDKEPDIKDQPGCHQEASFKGAIEFKNVTFHYERDNPILTNFDMKIKAGETVAIVGPTGGGKTTIASLISRYYEPQKGEILLDNVDSREYSQRALQGRIGVVLQTPHLFSGTILENILYGKPEGNKEMAKEAAQKAYAHKMILSLPKGYDEQVGEEGTLLSLGQKQLISLARTILANPDIIIMDEATSSVDTLTEKNIQKGMKILLSTRTSVVIAHRLSTIRNAHRILVVQKGHITEEGSHRDLLKLNGHYHHLYTSQFRRERSSNMLKE